MPQTKEQRAAWYKANKAKCVAKTKAYYQKNKDTIKERNRKNLHTPHGQKLNRISAWKKRGVISDNYEELYDEWLNAPNCYLCGVKLEDHKEADSRANCRCLDHCHISGEFRGILCISCNSSLPEQ